jgi:excisionase family DNA binding protein
MPSAWLSPPALAAELGVEPPKIIAWIKSGELLAVNVAQNVGGRPRYRISRAEVDRFLARRSSAPAPKEPRRRKAAEVIEFV